MLSSAILKFVLSTISVAPLEMASLTCSRINLAADSLTTGPKLVSFFKGSLRIYFSEKSFMPSTKSS